LPRLRGPTERKARHQLAVAAFVAESVPRDPLHERDDALRLDRPGIDADDADIVLEASAAERSREGHERGVASAPGDVVEIVVLSRGADVVDDHAAAPRLHALVNEARQVDVAEDLELPAVSPRFLAELAEPTGGNVAGVVDEDIDVCSGLRELFDVLAFAQIGDVHLRFDAVGFLQALSERLQSRRAPRRDVHVAAFLRKNLRDRRSDAFRSARDESALAT